MRTALMLGLGLGIGSLLIAPPAPAAEVKGLDGDYTIASGKHGQEDIPREGLAGRVRIADGKISLYEAEGADKPSYVIEYTVAKDGPPAQLAMKIVESTMPDAVGSAARGLVKVEGDTVTLIYDYQGGDPPADFLPRGDGQHLFVLKRRGGK